MLPAQSAASSYSLPPDLRQVLYVTVEPNSVHPAVLATIDIVIAVGAVAPDSMRHFGEAIGTELASPQASLAADGALMWTRGQAVSVIKPIVVERRQRRHQRKYAQGDLGAEGSFYFRGYDGRLNLRAQNLVIFLQLAEGVDDETWLFHRDRGDYSRWIRDRDQG